MSNAARQDKNHENPKATTAYGRSARAPSGACPDVSRRKGTEMSKTDAKTRYLSAKGQFFLAKDRLRSAKEALEKARAEFERDLRQ